MYLGTSLLEYLTNESYVQAPGFAGRMSGVCDREFYLSSPLLKEIFSYSPPVFSSVFFASCLNSFDVSLTVMLFAT